MKTKTAYLTFNTKKQKEFMRITPDVEKVVRESGETTHGKPPFLVSRMGHSTGTES